MDEWLFISTPGLRIGRMSLRNNKLPASEQLWKRRSCQSSYDNVVAQKLRAFGALTTDNITYKPETT
jgi:hypothetical protein